MKFYIASGLKNGKLVNDYSKKLEAHGWTHTYNWAKNLKPVQTAAELVAYAKWEQQGILDADAVILLLPAGRGAHIELGMALALNRWIFLCSATGEEFLLENTVNFYQLPRLIRLVGNVDENIKEMMKYEGEIMRN